MTRVALATAALCSLMSISLFVMAWRRLGIARVAWRALRVDPRHTSPGLQKFVGVLEPVGAVVHAPFTERAALMVRAGLHGVGPEGGALRPLWEKELIAPAQLRIRDIIVDLDLSRARMLVPREHRQGSLRALAAEMRVVPRALARAGYHSAPPAHQWFFLTEEVLLPGQRTTVLGEFDGMRSLRGTSSLPLVVSNLTPGRIMLRVAWGPALAMLMALIVMLTGASVVGAWLWLQ